ncbi:MAG: hypothetical protein HY874_00810 [Chloroflexi bacterium]|nr:hypothetical protein [Chloroflexota bacterium]
MEANGISLFDQEPSQKKDRTKLLLGAAVAFGVVAALGTGFVLGGRGGNSGDVAGATKEPERAAQVSPTANAGLGVVVEHGVGTTSGGPSSGGTTAPAPTSTPEPPAATSTAVPSTSTSTSTATATATAVAPTPTSTPVLPAPPLPPLPPCPWCPDGPVLPIDPSILPRLDFTAPALLSASWQDCSIGQVISFSVDENADMWVTYTDAFGPSETGHQSGTNAYFVISGFGTWFVTDVVIHAVDDAGNEIMASPLLAPCLEIGL